MFEYAAELGVGENEIFALIVESFAELIAFAVYDESIFHTFDRYIASSLLSMLGFLHEFHKSFSPEELLTTVPATGSLEHVTLLSVARCIFEGIIGYVITHKLALTDLAEKYGNRIESSDLRTVLNCLQLATGAEIEADLAMLNKN